jgi:hypothetical protein
MYNLVDLKINLKSNQSDKVIIVSLWVIFFTFISVFLSIIVIEFDVKRYKKVSKLIKVALSKWSKIAFSMLSMVVVAVAYGFLTNAIMYLYSFSPEAPEVSSTKQILYEFYDLDLVIPFVPIFLGLGLIAVLITNKFWIFTMETLIPEKEVVDILLASGNIIRNVYLYKSPIGKYIYVGNNKQHASATQIVAVNKKDIETILFKKEYENYHEKNQIIIQKRKR